MTKEMLLAELATRYDTKACSSRRRTRSPGSSMSIGRGIEHGSVGANLTLPAERGGLRPNFYKHFAPDGALRLESQLSRKPLPDVFVDIRCQSASFERKNLHLFNFLLARYIIIVNISTAVLELYYDRAIADFVSGDSGAAIQVTVERHDDFSLGKSL